MLGARGGVRAGGGGSTGAAGGGDLETAAQLGGHLLPHASSCLWRHSRVLRSDATKHGELATLQVNNLETKSKSSRLEVGVGRLSDTNTAKGRPLQVNTFSESVLP